MVGLYTDNMLDEAHFPYQVYMLRLWRNGTQTPWRAALEHARTGERHAFAELTDLFAFLEAETGADLPMIVSLEDTGNLGKSQLEEWRIDNLCLLP